MFQNVSCPCALRFASAPLLAVPVQGGVLAIDGVPTQCTIGMTASMPACPADDTACTPDAVGMAASMEAWRLPHVASSPDTIGCDASALTANLNGEMVLADHAPGSVILAVWGL